MNKIKKKIFKLYKKINYWRYLYYIKSNPEISDYEYDIILQKLNKLEYLNTKLCFNKSPTRNIGNILDNNFKKINHFKPMLSLKNIFSYKEFINFHNIISKKLNKNKIIYCCELKLDGVAINLLYKNNKLIKASTRGNGNIGEDITKNILYINDIPKKIILYNKYFTEFEIRGEIFIKNSNFNKLNNKYKKLDKKIFLNPRNMASGSLRQLNPLITKQRLLSFFCYDINLINKNNFFYNHWEKLQILKILGFPINKYSLICNNINDVMKYYKYIYNKRNNLNYPIDGIVIKINSIFMQQSLGCNSFAPKWAIAYKFPAIEKITLVLDVKFNVGRTGVITPIAILDPILISGAVISNVTLHNFNEINKLNLMIGDKVIICRSGDVIPKIINVMINIRSNNVKKILIPKNCPSCNSILEISKKTLIIKCLNSINCLSQRKKKILHFVSKNAMNIIGIGDNLINKLIIKKIIFDASDLFYLTKNKLLSINGINIKLTNKLLKSIIKSKKVNFANFIYSLGIPYVGKIISKILSLHFISIYQLINTNINILLKITDIGIIVSKCIINFFNNDNNINFIKKILLAKIIIIFPKINKLYNNIFLKKNIVITGTFKKWKRYKLENKLINLGGIIKNIITNKINIIIVGNKPGKKLLKSKFYNIKIINETELIKLLNKN